MWGHKEKVAICRPGREFSLETQPCWQLGFGGPRLQKGEKIHFCCWSHQSAVFCYDSQSWPGRALGEERRGRTAPTANPWQCLLSRRSDGVSAGRGEATPTQQTLQSGIDWNTAIRRNSTFYHESWLTQALESAKLSLNLSSATCQLCDCGKVNWPLWSHFLICQMNPMITFTLH